MPAAITHSEIASNINKYLMDYKEEFKIKTLISDDSIKKMSLGQDLTFDNSKLFKLSHEKYSQDFFIYLSKYIKKNKLYENSNIMSFLYGHIIHYSTDITFHPYVYYLESKLVKTDLISPHQLLEWTIDEIVSSFYGNHLKNIDNSFILNDVYDEKLKKLINKIYYKTYREKKVFKVYKKTEIKIFVLSEFLKQTFKLNKNKLPNIITNRFFYINNINNLDFIKNDNNYTWIHPVTNERLNYSIKDLINKSTLLSLKLIKIVNEYIYGYNNNNDEIITGFNNLSYNTGVNSGYQKKLMRSNH